MTGANERNGPFGPRARPSLRNISVVALRQGHTTPPFPDVDPDIDESGGVSIDPIVGVVGAWGTWTVTYLVGDEPIEELGGIRVQLPQAWHAGIRNSAFRLQGTSPREPNFVGARCSDPEVVLQAYVELESDPAIDKAGRVSSLTGWAGRYEYVARVIVRHGRVEPGETLAVVYGDTSGGSRGFRGGINATGPMPALIAVDHRGTGRFRLHSTQPSVALLASEPTALSVVAPSQGIVGRPMASSIALVDGFANPAVHTGRALTVSVAEGVVDAPVEVSIPGGSSWGEVSFVPRAAGIVRLCLTDTDHGLTATSNPIRVHPTEPEERVYWGDLHSHTEVSHDGIGSGRDAYEYARHVAGLDFYARTDHDSSFEPGYEVADFDRYVRLADEWNEPGRFATLHGVEVSFGAPFGHHNVYFRGDPVQVADEFNSTLPELWKALSTEEALTIPHHTMKTPAPIDWDDGDDPSLRRNFEIFSAHGLSEEFDPYHPLAIDQSLFTNASTTQHAGMSAQRAWEGGLQLSTIASSDDHRAQPGQPHQGLVAVLARDLTRADVFDALYERRTYATTGSRILLDFSVGGTGMGGRHTSGSRPVRVECSAVGTDRITLVEVLRHVEGVPGFPIVATRDPGADRFDWAFDDDPGEGGAIYYVRLRQREPIGGRIVMAWSSPVWVEGVTSVEEHGSEGAR